MRKVWPLSVTVAVPKACQASPARVPRTPKVFHTQGQRPNTAVATVAGLSSQVAVLARTNAAETRRLQVICRCKHAPHGLPAEVRHELAGKSDFNDQGPATSTFGLSGALQKTIVFDRAKPIESFRFEAVLVRCFCLLN